MTQPKFNVVSRTDATLHSPQAARDRLAALLEFLPPRSLDDSAPEFLASPELEAAINTALTVHAPLLLTGEPGTGKTQVAHYLKWYFGVPLFPFHVKSTSIAVDLKFDFDAVAYLHQAQAGALKQKARSEFLDKRALWRAYEEDGPSVVLIDEIDKAPRDFPNDLLHEIDQNGFPHPFGDGEPIVPKSGQPPIIIVTSNAERRLPDAFLRRCIVHHLTLDEALLRRIVDRRTETSFPALTQGVRDIAFDRFLELRQLGGLFRAPGTAELLAWLTVLSARGVSEERLNCALHDLPSIGALVKDHRDLTRIGE